ncbi:unnamed protein product [Mytilus coruscus]|uniref:CCHC-type domain-containing protein n=1 Tax=Mytilus coruscus TaxID=42192 RepID=A0A6J8DAK2_MYTCO|nr:unnamed protein product [Mytilus coruscus]
MTQGRHDHSWINTGAKKIQYEKLTKRPEKQYRKETPMAIRDNNRKSAKQIKKTMEEHLDNALEKQKKEISTAFEAKIQALNQLASKPDFKFKFISNKKQCEFNDQVSKDIDILKAAISSDNRDFALKTIKKVHQDSAARNKTVKIGDKHGWDTVSEYEGNPLADNSDDGRRLRQAETRAIRKRKTVATKDTSKRFAADKLFRGFSETPETRSYTNSSQTTPRYNGPRSSPAYSRARKGPSPQDICYYCGATGHWSSN